MTRIAEVVSSDGRRTYVISVANGQYQCSCVGWTRHMPRRDCKHIRQTKAASVQETIRETLPVLHAEPVPTPASSLAPAVQPEGDALAALRKTFTLLKGGL